MYVWCTCGDIAGVTVRDMIAPHTWERSFVVPELGKIITFRVNDGVKCVRSQDSSHSVKLSFLSVHISLH